MLQNVHVSDAHDVRYITLDRPSRKNALTDDMYAILANAFEAVETEVHIAAVVIASTGPVFCAGNDVNELLTAPPLDFDAPVFRFLMALCRTAVPVIVGVSGPAIGIGTSMLLHCDFVYATERSRFHMPFVDLGLVPEAASSLLLPRVTGHLKAAEMIFLGRPFTACEAVDVGLVSRVVEDDSALKASIEDTVVTLKRKPRSSLRESKRLLRSDRFAVEDRMRAEHAIFTLQLQTTETQAALSALTRR